ncbi:MAG: PaaI family thioesterase [Polyangiaceae bacterium]|nr:PaaI family thioesterase [Polyangiaceae bacterium]
MSGPPGAHDHPFGQLLGLRVEEAAAGRSVLSLVIAAHHLNPNRVVHGGVVYSLADTGMGAALYSTLAETEAGATVELKINYLAAAREGALRCETTLIGRSGRLAVLESRVTSSAELVAVALGTFSVFARRG